LGYRRAGEFSPFLARSSVARSYRYGGKLKMNWFKEKLEDVLGLGVGVLKARSTLVAQRKILSHQGQLLLSDGYPLQQLMYDRPGLWLPDKATRRVVKNKCVTDDFCEDIVDTMQSSVAAFSTYKYHHSGTGAGAEAATDAALVTPVEDARAVGTQVDGASAKEYKSIATITYAAGHSIIEHGLFNTAGAGGPPVVGGRMLDRALFGVITVVATNAIEFTYTIALTSGG
jgi:hypothetical protein